MELVIRMKSNKRVTSIYILDEVREYCETHNMNFSQWANKSFLEQYLSLGSKVRELAETLKHAEDLKHQIKRIKEEAAGLVAKLTPDQKDFMRGIPSLLKDGKDLMAIKSRFNEQFKTRYSQDEFLLMMEFIINDYW